MFFFLYFLRPEISKMQKMIVSRYTILDIYLRSGYIDPIDLDFLLGDSVQEQVCKDD